MKVSLTSLAGIAMSTVAAAAGASENRPAVVLVHGAFVDGSGWAGVHRLLRADGYTVFVVQNPTTTLAEDVAATRRALDAANGDVILVGHSYGGAVITEAGSDPRVSALVYVAAFAPDQGESVSSITASAPPGAPGPPIRPTADGYLLLDREEFATAFAADLPPDTAHFMADSQLPWGAQALQGKVSAAAWKTKPSWYVIPEDDRMIPPDAQRAMAGRAGATVRLVPGSHAFYVVNPLPIVEVIRQAAAARKSPKTLSGNAARPVQNPVDSYGPRDSTSP